MQQISVTMQLSRMLRHRSKPEMNMAVKPQLLSNLAFYSCYKACMCIPHTFHGQLPLRACMLMAIQRHADLFSVYLELIQYAKCQRNQTSTVIVQL
jgi:hypothetical protein